MKLTSQESRKLETRTAQDGPYKDGDIPFYEGQKDTIIFTAKGQRGQYLARRGAVWRPL